MQLPVRSAPQRVARVEPAVAPGFVGRRLVLVVAREEAFPRIGPFLPYQQLAGFFLDAQIQVRWRKAHAARADVAWLVAGGDERAAAGLGHCPGFDQREAEA